MTEFRKSALAVHTASAPIEPWSRLVCQDDGPLVLAALESNAAVPFALDHDGTLHVTTPSGVTRTTRPPGLRPPRPETPDPGNSPPTPPTPDDELRPF